MKATQVNSRRENGTDMHEDDWIRVEDRLPEESTEAEVFVDDEFIWRASYHPRYKKWFRD